MTFALIVDDRPYVPNSVADQRGPLVLAQKCADIPDRSRERGDSTWISHFDEISAIFLATDQDEPFYED